MAQIGESTFSQVLPGARTKRYTASAAFLAQTISTAPDSSGEVTTATSGSGYGVFANSGSAGDSAEVVVEGPALLKFGATVAVGAAVIAGAGGEGAPAGGTGVKSIIRLTPDSPQLNQVVDGDVAEVTVGVGAVSGT